MAPYFLIKGMAIGFSVAAPVGPIGMLCIRRSLADGRGVGLATGLGAATADAVYGAIAGFGLTAVTAFLIHQKMWLNIFGGIFLCVLGIRIFSSTPVIRTAEERKIDLLPAYFSTLLLTLANPVTILSFVAVFAGLGLAGAADYRTAALLVTGVFVGSALWWVILSQLTGMSRSWINDAWMRTVNRLSGGFIFGFGIYSFWSLYRDHARATI
jgi:threonine/homoserine/homoserine lactone efflux protein